MSTTMNTPDRSGCSAPRHGTESAYRVGCRCPDARAIVRTLQKRRSHGLHPPALVDNTGTSRRLQALAAIGWPGDELARRLGMAARGLSYWRSPRTPLIHRDNAARIAALYEQLSGTPGPSPNARRNAARRGWAPPLLWEDTNIDDPASAPHRDDHRPGKGTPRIDLDDINHLAGYGMSLTHIAARLGVNPESITTAQRRTTKKEAA